MPGAVGKYPCIKLLPSGSLLLIGRRKNRYRVGRRESRALLNLVKFEMAVSYSNGKAFGLFDLFDPQRRCLDYRLHLGVVGI